MTGSETKTIILGKTWNKYENQNISYTYEGRLGVPSKKTNSLFKDIIQIEVDPPPSQLIFDKIIFDTVLIMLTFLLPLEFFTKIIKF